jgi:hypothetical protein
MTRNEMLAHNAGVLAVLALAIRSAQALESRLTEKPTRFNFAIGALQALAGEGASLLLPIPPRGGEPADAVTPQPPKLPTSSLQEAVDG